MTDFEKLLIMSAERPVSHRLDAASEKIAEDMAREIIRDPAWRAEVQHLIAELARRLHRRRR